MLQPPDGRKLWIQTAAGEFEPVTSYAQIQERKRGQGAADWWVVARPSHWRPPAGSGPGAGMKPNSHGQMQPYDRLGQYAGPGRSGGSADPGKGAGKRRSLILAELDGEGAAQGEAGESEVYGRADHKGRLPKKSTVRDENLDRRITERYEEISEIFERHKVPLLVTSANDSVHSKGSLHYEDKAIDLRGNHVSKSKLRELAGELQEKLGKDYDVLAEEKYELRDGKKVDVSHIHIEYDPKSGRKE